MIIRLGAWLYYNLLSEDPKRSLLGDSQHNPELLRKKAGYKYWKSQASTVLLY